MLNFVLTINGKFPGIIQMTYFSEMYFVII